MAVESERTTPDETRKQTLLESLRIELPSHGVSLEALERELILKALEHCNWNQTHAAEYLRLSRKTLIYRMEKYGLHKARRAY